MTTEKINQATTRAEVQEVLKGLKLIELKEIAKVYSVHCRVVNKSNLIDKITEATIGARLRSEAIKGISLK